MFVLNRTVQFNYRDINSIYWLIDACHCYPKRPHSSQLLQENGFASSRIALHWCTRHFVHVLVVEDKLTINNRSMLISPARASVFARRGSRKPSGLSTSLPLTTKPADVGHSTTNSPIINHISVKVTTCTLMMFDPSATQPSIVVARNYGADRVKLSCQELVTAKRKNSFMSIV